MEIGAPVIATLAVWWASTGVILYLGERSELCRRLAMGLISILALIALAMVWSMRDTTTTSTAYFGALSALTIWAWHEMSFLFGFITGPNKTPCPPDLSGWTRFRAATATLIHHEVALAATLLIIAAMSIGADNTVALQVFAMLFAFRLSSKFNLFIGAPHFTDQFLPHRLAHLRSYFSQEKPGPFFVVSTLTISIVAAALMWAAINATSPFAAASFALLASLAALGALEHLFLVLPLPDATLWRWLLPERDPRRTPD